MCVSVDLERGGRASQGCPLRWGARGFDLALQADAQGFLPLPITDSLTLDLFEFGCWQATRYVTYAQRCLSEMKAGLCQGVPTGL
jgi:hypothetical protein